MEPRTLLSSFSLGDVNGTYALQAMGSTGTAQFDGNGNIVGGATTNEDGSAGTPSGTYTVAPDGTFSLTGADGTVNPGAINSSKNFIAVSRPSSSGDNLGTLISGAGAVFSDADVKGTWYLFENGLSGPPDNFPTQEVNNSGHATVVLDGLGGFTYTNVDDESGQAETGAGTYSVSPTGAVSVQITTSSNPNSDLPAFSGQMNNSKDVIAMDAANLPGAAATDNTRLILMVQPSGSYSNASMQGTWSLSTDGGDGTITFDGNGNINGSFTSNNNNNGSAGSIQTDAVTGTYSVSANGSFTIAPVTAGQTHPMLPLSGWINASGNVTVVDTPNGGQQGVDDMAVFVNSNTPLGATVSLTNSGSTIAPGVPLTLTATVSPLRISNNNLSGTVNFFDGSTQIGSAPVPATGIASFTTSALVAGSHSITANYSGDSAYSPVVSLAATVLISAPKAVGQLDPTFGNQGLAGHVVGFTNTAGVAPDGAQSILIGSVGTAPNELFGVTRYNADGSLDTTFGTGGIINTGFGTTDDVPGAVTVLPNGQILVAGTATSTGSQFAVAEYNADGSVDTSFGSGTGQVLVSFSNTAGTLSNDVLKSIAVGPDGTIYLGGLSDANGTSGNDFAIAALNADGSLDTNFGTGGKLLQDFSGGNDSLNSLALQPNGDLVAAGSATIGGVTEIAVARFLPGGLLDGRFGNKGVITTSVRGLFDSASSVVLQPTGEIVVGGVSATGSGATLTSDFVLVRYTPAGRIDKTFGGGPVITNLGEPSAVTQLVLQPGGSIVASGKATASLTGTLSAIKLAIARYTTRGVLDTTFDGTGSTIVDLTSDVGGDAVHTGTFSDVEIQPLGASSLGSAFDQFIGSLQGVVATTTGGAIISAGNNGSNTIEAELVTSGVDLVATMLGAIPAAVIGGAKGTASVQIAESGTLVATGTITIDLEFASDAQGDGATAVKATAEKINLRQQKSHSYKLTFVYPQSLMAGNYYLVANVLEGSALSDLNLQNNLSASHATVKISPPAISLVASEVTTRSTFTTGKSVTLTFTVLNSGDVLAKGSTTVNVLLSPDQITADGTTVATGKLAVGVPANKSHTYRISFKLPAMIAAGSYYLIAVVDPVDSLGSIDHSDSTAVDPAVVVVS